MHFYFINTDINSWVAWNITNEANLINPSEAKLMTLMLIEMTLDDSDELRFTESGDSVYIYLNEKQINGMIHTSEGLEQVPCVTSYISHLELLKKPVQHGTA